MKKTLMMAAVAVAAACGGALAGEFRPESSGLALVREAAAEIAVPVPGAADTVQKKQTLKSRHAEVYAAFSMDKAAAAAGALRRAGARILDLRSVNRGGGFAFEIDFVHQSELKRYKGAAGGYEDAQSSLGLTRGMFGELGRAVIYGELEKAGEAWRPVLYYFESAGVAGASRTGKAALAQPAILPEPEHQVSCSDKDGAIRLDGRVSRKGAGLTVVSRELYSGLHGDREQVWFEAAGGQQAPGLLRFESSGSNFYWFDLTLPESVLAAPAGFPASLVISFNDESRREVKLYCSSK